MSLFLLNVKLCGKGNALKNLFCLLSGEIINWAFIKSFTESRWVSDINEFQRNEKVPTFRFLAIDCSSAHCIK